MTDAFTGEIRAFYFQHPPEQWLLCNGDTLKIEGDNWALYSVIGNAYGGDGRTTFRLPDLRGLAAMGTGTGSDGATSRTANLAKTMGTASVQLTTAQMPAHIHEAQGHQVQANGTAGPARNAYVSIPRMSNTAYDGWTPPKGGTPTATTLSPLTLGAAGGEPRTGTTQPHENRSPYLAVNFCICVNGIYPSRGR